MQQVELVLSGIGPVDRELGGLPARGIAIWWGAPGGGKTTAALSFLRVALSTGEGAGVITTHTADAVREQARAQLGLDLAPYERSGQLLLFDVSQLGALMSPDPHQTLAALRQTLTRECGRRAIRRLVFDPLDPLVANTRPDDVAQLAAELEALFGQLGTTTLCTAYRGLGEHPVLEALASHAPATFDVSPHGLWIRRAAWSTLSGKSISLDSEQPFPSNLIGGIGAPPQPEPLEPPRHRRRTRRGGELKSTSRDLPSTRIQERLDEMRPTRPFERVSRAELMGQAMLEQAPPLPDELDPPDDDLTNPRPGSGEALVDDFAGDSDDGLPTILRDSRRPSPPQAVPTEAAFDANESLTPPSAPESADAELEQLAPFDDATLDGTTAPGLRGGLDATATTVDSSLSIRFSSEVAVGEGFDDDEPTNAEGLGDDEKPVSQSVLFGRDVEGEAGEQAARALRGSVRRERIGEADQTADFDDITVARRGNRKR